MRWIALPLVCIAVAGVAATAATAMEARSVLTATTGPTAPLATGIGGPLFQGPQASTAFAMASQAGATYARVLVHWDSIAPKKLPSAGFRAADPSSPYYDWTSLDASVSAANAAGITPILDIVAPPSWGYRVRPRTGTGGSPKLGSLSAFATALATHYDGSSPTAHVFSVWNEPNFSKNLYPQDPAYYRSMVNAVAGSVHAVDPTDLVAAGELAPFKHNPVGADRQWVVAPLTFMREMLCISTTKPVRRTCNKKAHFDVWAHHPYSDTGPYGHAEARGGVELGDLPKMNTLLRTAEKLGAIASARRVQFWVTEVGWSSKPPNTKGIPMNLEARWVGESFYQMWKSGVTLGTWFLLQDLPRNTPFQSGLYYASSSLTDAKAKPLLTPFKFPFVAYLKAHGKVQIWGRDATSNRQEVTIRDRVGSGGTWKTWRTVATVAANKFGIFKATLPLGATSSDSLQAYAPGSGTSAVFSLTVPKNENLFVSPFPHGG